MIQLQLPTTTESQISYQESCQDMIDRERGGKGLRLLISMCVGEQDCTPMADVLSMLGFVSWIVYCCSGGLRLSVCPIFSSSGCRNSVFEDLISIFDSTTGCLRTQVFFLR